MSGYIGPVTQAWTHRLPMMQQTVDALQSWSERLSNELLERTLAQFEAQNIDF